MNAESLEKKIAELFACLLEVILLKSGNWLINMEDSNDPGI